MFYVITILIFVLFINGISKCNIILIFYVRSCCLVRGLLLMFYDINNDDYIIMIGRYFEVNQYPFCIILL